MSDGDAEKFENGTGDIVEFELEQSLRNVCTSLAACGTWLSSKPSVGYDPLISLFRPGGAVGAWETVINDGYLTSDQIRRLRAVIDCNTGLPIARWDNLPVENSHGLLISLRNGPRAEHADFAAGVLTVVDDDQENQASSVLRRMEDIMLDINVFYRNPVLPGLFSTLKSKQSFDADKREYILARYGVTGPSLASLARDRGTGDFDPERYRCLWGDFMENWLLPGLLEEKCSVPTPADDPVPFQQLAERHFTKILKTSGKLHGQVSASKLRRACAKYATDAQSVGGVLALCILIKWPKRKEDQLHLSRLLGSSSLHLKKMALVEACRCPELFRWLPYLHVAFLDITFTIPPK